HRDRGDLVAALAHEPGEPLALRADDDDERRGRQLQAGQLDVAVHVEPDDEEARCAVVRERPGEVARPGDGQAGRSAAGGRPGRRGHAGAAPGGDAATAVTEGGRRAHARAEVARVRDRVERADERYPGQLGVDEVLRVRVLV